MRSTCPRSRYIVTIAWRFSPSMTRFLASEADADALFRPGAAPAGLAEVVATLLWRGRGRGHALRQIPVSARQVEDKPVDEAAGVRVVDHEHQRRRPRLHPGPLQWRRDIRAVAGELARDGVTVGERGGCQDERPTGTR